MHCVTAYANIYNIFNRECEEAAGYPALHTQISAPGFAPGSVGD